MSKKNGYTYDSIMKILDFNFGKKASKVSSNVSSVCSQENDTESSPYIDQDLKTHKMTGNDISGREEGKY